MIIFTSAKEVMFSSASVSLFVSRITPKLLDRFSQKSVVRRQVRHGETISFGGNPDHLTLELRLW